MTGILFICFFMITIYVVGVRALNKDMNANAIRSWRNGLTILLILFAGLMLLRGQYYGLMAVVLLLPIMRNLLNPERGKVTEEVKAEIDSAMTREEALRILELDNDNATAEAVETSFIRLIKLVHPDHGGTSYFATKVTAARDFMRRNPTEIL